MIEITAMMNLLASCVLLSLFGCCYALLTPSSFSRKFRTPWRRSNQRYFDWAKSTRSRPAPPFLSPAEEAVKLAKGPMQLVPRRTPMVTDWGGTVLQKKVLQQLQVGDIVRVQVQLRDTHTRAQLSLGAPYFTVTKVKPLKNKDTLLWGEALNQYGTIEDCYPPEILQEGQIFPFTTRHVLEIPICWHTRQRRKQLKSFRMKKARVITGVF